MEATTSGTAMTRTFRQISVGSLYNLKRTEPSVITEAVHFGLGSTGTSGIDTQSQDNL